MAWIAWKRGKYNRSKNHMTRDEEHTFCGRKIPKQSLKVKVFFGYEGVGECKACQAVWDRELDVYERKYVNRNWLEVKSGS